MSKKIIITESQEQQLLEYMICEKTFPIDTTKVLVVKDYLDKHFKKGKLSKFGNDGFPVDEPVVGMKGGDGEVVKNLTARQLLDILEEFSKSLFTNTIEQEKFLIQVMKDWYYNRISKEGLLSVTHC